MLAQVREAEAGITSAAELAMASSASVSAPAVAPVAPSGPPAATPVVVHTLTVKRKPVPAPVGGEEPAKKAKGTDAEATETPAPL